MTRLCPSRSTKPRRDCPSLCHFFELAVGLIGQSPASSVFIHCTSGTLLFAKFRNLCQQISYPFLGLVGSLKQIHLYTFRDILHAQTRACHRTCTASRAKPQHSCKRHVSSIEWFKYEQSVADRHLAKSSRSQMFALPGDS